MALAQILLRRGTSAEWAAANPVLASGEFGYDTTSKRAKVGDGAAAWTALPWITMGAGDVTRLEAAAAALEGATAPTDAAMTTIQANPNSAFAQAQKATIDAGVAKAAPAAVAHENAQAVRAAAAFRVDFDRKSVTLAGVAQEYVESVTGTGDIVGATLGNLMSSYLPFAGASVAGNTFPTGIDVHQFLTGPTLKEWSADSITLELKTVSGFSGGMGGIRTQGIVPQNTSVDVSFDAALVNLSASTETASLVVELTHAGNDGDSNTTGPKVVMSLREDPKQVRVRLAAPSGGVAYRLAIWVKTSDATVDQKVLFTLSNLMVTSAGSAPIVGSRYGFPRYNAKQVWARNTLVKPGVSAGDYILLARADEFGWFCEVITLAANATIDLRAVLGGAPHVTFRELMLFPYANWAAGMLDLLDPPKFRSTRWIDGATTATSGPQSPGALSRITGVFQPNQTLNAHPKPYAIEYVPSRLRHLRARAGIGDHWNVDTASGNHSQRAELYDYSDFGNAPIWISTWVCARSTVLSQFAILFQGGRPRSGSSTATLSPEFDVRLLPGNQMYLKLRSDGGTEVMSGDGDAAGITVNTFGPFPLGTDAWHHVLLRLTTSKTGAGSADMWIDGTKVVNNRGPLGYNRAGAFQLHYGLYSYAADTDLTVEQAALEYGNRDLSSRAARPIPFR